LCRTNKGMLLPFSSVLALSNAAAVGSLCHFSAESLQVCRGDLEHGPANWYFACFVAHGGDLPLLQYSVIMTF
jgi:hypothetical protein